MSFGFSRIVVMMILRLAEMIDQSLVLLSRQDLSRVHLAVGVRPFP